LVLRSLSAVPSEGAITSAGRRWSCSGHSHVQLNGYSEMDAVDVRFVKDRLLPLTRAGQTDGGFPCMT
jgi:hypothetical protein